MAVAGCAPRYSYKYKLTIEVDANGRLYTGSAIAEVNSQSTGALSLQPHYLRTWSRGEATVVDLGDGHLLVALLDGLPESTPFAARGDRKWTGPGPTGILLAHLGFSGAWDGDTSDGLEKLTHARGVVEIAPNELPLLVTFKDPRNPSSIQMIEPENLDEAFGLGVRLRRATLELTDDRLESKIIHHLPWLDRSSAVVGKAQPHTYATDIVFRRSQFKR